MNFAYCYFTCFFLLIFCEIYVVFGFDKLNPDNVSNDVTRNIHFLFYNGPTVNDYVIIPYEDGLAIGEQPRFNKYADTVFYYHGWTEEPSKNEDSVDTIAAAFLERNFANLIVLDYSQLVKGDGFPNYLSSAKNVTQVGSAMGYFFSHFIPYYQDIEWIHLVGHSLGSQAISFTAKSYGSGLFHWLTGLDPAGPLFNIPLIDHLSREDGKFVDIIHTDSWRYGDGRSVGHADFFPNRGDRTQPYCPKDNSYEFCSHHMSWRYYAESVRNNHAFPAKRCDTNLFCNRFNLQWCCDKNGAINHMGYGVNKNVHGDFFLKTNDHYPYDMGDKGFFV